MFKLTVFIPNEALEDVKTALFDAGAGKIGNYSHCCWQVQGTGQFKPLTGSNPHIGNHNSIEKVAEWRVEMVVADENLDAVVDALKQAHPYETPAFDVIQTINV